MDKDKIYEIAKKYRLHPRVGYSIKNSRKKADETIEVNRKEICDILDESYNLIFAHEHFLEDSLFYEKILGILATEGKNFTRCNKCGGTYSVSWFNGNCPYCEIEHSNHEIFVTSSLGK